MVRHPNGDLYRVITKGDGDDAIKDARRATGEMRYPVPQWQLVSESGVTDAKVSVRKLDEYEARKHLDVLELTQRSAEKIEQLEREGKLPVKLTGNKE